MSKRVPCKFFAKGSCLKGDGCSFLHEQRLPSNNVCFAYQKGNCAYGARCRYHHVKLSQSPGSDISPSMEKLVITEHGIVIVQREGAEPLSSDILVTPPVGPAQGEGSGDHEMQRTSDGDHRADLSLCDFPTVDDCPRGERCPLVHGDLCSTCGKHCLHPFRPKEMEEHIDTCQKRQKQLESIKLSKDIECNVCLDRVLSKSPPGDRKFGILPECNHSFCLSCIRNWRRSSADYSYYTHSAVRACPTCRKTSYFVVPSNVWYSSEEEKQEIISSYKENLRSIDCKYFDFGNGKCLFGSNCFYKHTVEPGSLMWFESLNIYKHIDEDQESEYSGGITDTAIEAMLSEITNEDAPGPGDPGPIENPDAQGVQLLDDHIYQPCRLTNEEHNRDEGCNVEQSDERLADILRISMMQANMANSSSDDE